MPSFYDIGDVAVLAVKTYAVDGMTLADAGANPTCVVTLPDLTTSSPTVSHGATGNYSAPFTVTQHGLHSVAWSVSTGLTAAYKDTFHPEPFESVVGLQVAKDYLNKNGVLDTPDDEELRRVCVAATQLAETRSRQTWYRRTVTTLFSPVYNQTAIALPVGTSAVTTVTEYGVTLSPSTDYVFDASSGVLYRGGGYAFYVWGVGAAAVSVTYTVGPSFVPADIRQAVLEIVADFWGTQTATVTPAAEDFYTGGIGSPIPTRAAAILDSYAAASSGFA